MNVPETEAQLFSCLAAQTRELGRRTDLEAFTTAGLSKRLQVSRNLASHYLNDLVRANLVIKAGTRPVYYFSRRDLERLFQTSLPRASYASFDELLQERNVLELHDFERAVGHDLSLASAIEKLKAAVKYPPCGLPVLVSGGKGTGKTLLSRLMCDYGKRTGVLGRDAAAVVVDAAAYAADPEALVRDFEGAEGVGSLVERSQGGLVIIRDVERLAPSSQSFLISLLFGEGGVPRVQPPRLVFLTTCAPDDPAIAAMSRAVPVTVELPSLVMRTAEEREELVLGLFKAEGRRLGADVLVSRPAFNCLVEAAFEDNIQGLASCVTSVCAAAYLDHSADTLEIQAYLLPGFVLDAASMAGELRRAGATELIDTTRALEHSGESRSVRAFSSMLETYRAYASGEVTAAALLDEAVVQVRDYEDYLVFDYESTSERAAAYERILAGIVDELNATYGLDLSKKSARVVARCIHVQVHSGSRLAQWREANQTELAGLLAALLGASEFGRFASERAGAMVEQALGVQLDVLTRIFLLVVVYEADRRQTRRQSVGIVLSHGYSTATSIADAANRILKSRVFEAIDMKYDQEVKDIVAPLRELLDAYAFCNQIAILVDMGSLEHVLEDLDMPANVTVGVVTGASTAVALEVGAGLVAGEPLSELLPAATAACASRYKIVEARVLEPALVFCSEGGPQAAERIKSLVERSLEASCPLRLMACSPQQLRREGITERYDVLAAIGTDDPAIEGVPFIALEDLIAGEKSAGVDEVFSRFLSDDELARFHQNLVKTLTLRNVIESITILNPEKVLGEVEAAVDRLQQLLGMNLGAHTMIGLCVHLCCLIERLVTHNTIESYVDVERFCAEHEDFIDSFQQSFRDIARHYHVEVPVTEIAYAYDYVHQKSGR